MRGVRLSACALVWMWLASCASTPLSHSNRSLHNQTPHGFEAIKSIINPQIFGPRPDIPDIPSLYTLDAQHQADLISYMNDPAFEAVSPHKRLANFIEKNIGDYHYRGNTYTASESLDFKAGNCVSLAIVTTAYAKVAGIQISYQEAHSLPVYGRDQGVETISSHVVTKLYDPNFVREPNVIYAIAPHVVIDYFPTSNSWRGTSVSEDEFNSFYYRNVASDLLIEGRIDEAGWWAYRAYQLAPKSVETINLLGVIHRRKGNADLAEQIYKHGLEALPDDLELNINLRFLLKTQGRFDEVEQIEQKIAKLEDPSPFHWYDLGLDYYEQGRYRQAVLAFDKMIERAPYLHFGYAGKGRALYQLGRKKAARDNLALALQHTHEDKTEALYQAKMSALSVSEHQ